VGLALWAVAGSASFLLARLVPVGRSGWAGELAVSLLAAIALGLLATALDFGGWREPDWRAISFAFLGAFAATGLARGASLLYWRISTRGAP